MVIELVTQAERKVLRHLRRYWYQRNSQIRDAVAPDDRDGSVTRARMRKLAGLGLVRRHDPKMIDPVSGQAAPIWVLTVKGSNWLAATTGDCSLLLSAEPSFTDWMSLNHYCALGELHWRLDRVFSAQDQVQLLSLTFEHELARGPGQQRKRILYEVVQETPRVECKPDTAIETQLAGRPDSRRLWYGEYETGADGSPARIAATKRRGYQEVMSRQLWRRSFPEACDARVIFWCPNAGWRNGLRAAFREYGGDWWLFADHEIGEDFLHAPALYTVDRGPFPLVPPLSTPAADGRSGNRSEATA